MRLRSVLILILLAGSAVQAWATDYHTHKSGSDSNSCTTAQASGASAKLTIASGIACVMAAGGAGHRLLIHAGTYSERIDTNVITLPTGTSYANAPIIQAAPLEVVTLNPTGQIMNLTQANLRYLIFDGLVFDGANGNSFGIGTNSAAMDHLRFQNMEIKNTKLSGVILGENTSFFEFLNMRVHNNGSVPVGGVGNHGFYICGDNHLIDNADIYNNNQYGIQIYSSGAGCSTNTIRNSKIHHNNVGGWSAGGIHLGAGNGNVAYNNVIYSNPGSYGIQVDSFNPANTLVYGNTSYGNGFSGLYIAPGATGTNARNNISYSNGSPLIDNQGSGSTVSQNLTTNPGFVNAAGGDFHIAAAVSPAINAGATLGSPYNVDIEGVNRPSAQYTIGAYQFVAGGGGPGPTGNVAKYSFEGVVTDASGQGNHGALVGNATYGAGISGSQGLSLDGVGDYVTVPDAASLRPAAAICLSSWIKPTAGNPLWAIINKGASYQIYGASDGQLYGWFYNGSSWPTVETTDATLLDGAWHHVVLTYDGAALRLYVDNAQKGFLAATGSITHGSGEALLIGRETGSTTRDFAGLIDQEYVFDQVCDAAAVQNLYNEQVPIAGLSVTHTAWYQANAAEGVALGAVDSDRSHALSLPIGLRFAIHKSDTGSLTEYFRPFCRTNTGGGYGPWTEVANTLGSLGVRFHVDSVVALGDPTTALLPLESFTGIAGKFISGLVDLTSPYDAGQRMTLAQSQHAEQEVRFSFGAPLTAGALVQCKPRRENGADFDGYGGAGDPAIRTLTLQTVAPPTAGRVGGTVSGMTIR